MRKQKIISQKSIACKFQNNPSVLKKYPPRSNISFHSLHRYEIQKSKNISIYEMWNMEYNRKNEIKYKRKVRLNVKDLRLRRKRRTVITHERKKIEEEFGGMVDRKYLLEDHRCSNSKYFLLQRNFSSFYNTRTGTRFRKSSDENIGSTRPWSIRTQN